MTVAGLANDMAQYVASARRRSVLLLFAAAFGVVYVPLTISTLLLGTYPHTIDTITVILTLVLATAMCAWIAWLRLPWYQPLESERRRENLGWALIGLNAAVVLVARVAYAVDELSGAQPGAGIPFADVLFGVSFIFLAIGILVLPWSSEQDGGRGWLLDAGIIYAAVSSVLWPLLIGPVQDGGFGDEVSVVSMMAYLIASFVLLTIALWRLMHGVRPELLAVAVSLSLAVFAIVLTLVGFLALSVSGYSANDSLLFTNAMTSLGFMLITLAAVLRLQVTAQYSEEEDTPVAIESPVHRWEIILPYPLIGVILVLRLIMEVFDWRTDYSGGMLIGSLAIVALLMYRQFQLLRYNDRLYEHVASAAIRDGLTGLYNHRAMHEILEKQAAQADRGEQSVALIFLDVDHFKKYNDTYGHRQGDGLLSSVAGLLLQQCRESDYVGRYGGEEFLVIAPGAGAAEACALAERLRTTIEGTHYVHNGTRSAVTASVGIALYPDDGDQPDLVLQRADEAMYRAKSAGRNRTVLFEPA